MTSLNRLILDHPVTDISRNLGKAKSPVVVVNGQVAFLWDENNP